MKDSRDLGRRDKVPARYRLGGNGGKACGGVRRRDGEDGRDGCLVERKGFESSLGSRIDGSVWREYEYSPRAKFEWESLMDGRLGGDEYHRTRSGVIEEHDGRRFPELRGREDVFRENMDLETERELEMLCSRHEVGGNVSPQRVDERLYLPAQNGYSSVRGKERVEGERQKKDELTGRGNYLHEESKNSLFSENGPCHMMPSQTQYRLSRPPSFGNLSDTGEKNPRAEQVDSGDFSLEDNGLGFQSDYVPLLKASKYPPQSTTQSPLYTGKPRYHMEQSLMEKSGDGNPESHRRLIREDGLGINSGNGPHCVSSSPFVSWSNAEAPLSTGYGTDESEHALVRKSPATDHIANKKYYHKNDGARNYSDYVHSYMMPSPQSKSKAVTHQVCASSNKEQAFIEKLAVAERIGREIYYSEKDEPGYHTAGLHHVMPPLSEFEPETMPSKSVLCASDPVAKSVTRLLPKPQQCRRIKVPLPGHSSLPDTELSRETYLRRKELHPNDSDRATHSFYCRKEESCTKDQNFVDSEEDVRRRCDLSFHRKLSGTPEDYGPKDRLRVHVMNGADTRGYSLEHNLVPQDEDLFIHPHDDVVPHHHNPDAEVSHHYMIPNNVKAKVHYHEFRKSEAQKVQLDMFDQPDNGPDAHFMDGDSYIGKRQRDDLHTGYFHSCSCCDSSQHGIDRAPLRGCYGYVRDSCSTIKKPHIKHKEHVLKRLGEKTDDGFEHLSSGDMQCQMLLERSACLQNRDFAGVGEEAFINTLDYHCRLPFKKLPVKMRLGKPNDSADPDIKKRLRPCTQVNDSLLSKKHKSSSPSIGKHDAREPYQSLSPDTSTPMFTSEIAKLDEQSDRFKEQVNRAFLESVKHLFESSAQQRKFKGLDKYESIRCDVCGSSREFKDTYSLAKHAFSYVKMDLRAQHLGLHNALCVLMGWNSNSVPDNPKNTLDLSEPEHSAMKEDLIIWPPVVIVHNSSVGNKDLRKQKIVTVRKLESILEGEGFCANNHKLHVGNDQGIMVVRFNATRSGLQAAQDLHKFYANNKHGRDELQHNTQSGRCSSLEESEKADPKVEDILYGYLGIVEDLPKLDSQIKKWSVIKSKKELLAMAS